MILCWISSNVHKLEKWSCRGEMHCCLSCTRAMIRLIITVFTTHQKQRRICLLSAHWPQAACFSIFHFIDLFVVWFSQPNGEIIVIWRRTPLLRFNDQPPSPHSRPHTHTPSFCYVWPLRPSTQREKGRLSLSEQPSSCPSVLVSAAQQWLDQPKSTCLLHIDGWKWKRSQQLRAFVFHLFKGDCWEQWYWVDLTVWIWPLQKGSSIKNCFMSFQ